jgi:RES domain-containing protein
MHARLDGSGAQRVGGRWNSRGHAVVYMAESVALAVLENLIHLSRQDFPIGYVTVGATIPDNVEILGEEWVRALAGMPAATPPTIGDYWIERNLSAVLRVPSFIVRSESNYLLNPAHPEFRRIIVERPISFEFDPRLFA